ncbi:MAG TPA: glycosyltransferase [Candidatus Saccharimonadales bacterium]|nr:glycosyltransferase [Candidatus Saccharimonadales bacterium]
MKKTILVDAQVLQSSAWDRGMGKSTFKLLNALHKFYKGEIHLIFNTNLPKNPVMRKLIVKEMPNFVQHDIALLIPSDVKKVHLLQEPNKQLLDEFVLKNQFDPENTIFYIPALFLWPACSVFPSGTINTILMHDIIPLLYSDKYFSSMRVEDYLAQFKMIMQADHIFTVSESVRDDMLTHLGIEGSRVSAINGAAVIDVEPSKSYGKQFKKPFVLMPTGNDLRKNNQRSAAAFAKYLEKTGQDVDLVTTSFYTDFEQQELRRIVGSIKFTGNVQDPELVWLFENCQSVLFASESEGLGLPMLEAVMHGKPVVCSDIPVFKEISHDGFYYADPYSTESITVAIEKAQTIGLSAEMKKEYQRIKADFTWNNVAQRFDAAIANLKPARGIVKPKIAILGPTPSGYSGPGKMLGQMHPALSRAFDIDYYLEASIVDDRDIRPNYLKYVADCYPVKFFNAKRYREYDAVVYHMGNSENHLIITQHALALPGIAIIHDTHMFNVYRFLREEGVMDKRRVELEEKLNALVKNELSSYVTSIANSQLGLIVHSDYAKNAVNDLLEGKVELVRADLPYQNPGFNVHERKVNQIHIGVAGMLAGVKGLTMIEDLANDQRFKNCIFDVFGFNFAEAGLLERLESVDNIRLTTNLTDQEYQTRMQHVDVIINFRNEYRGESSSVTLEAMRFGIPSIVRNIGWYSELPDDCVIKVESQNQVAEALAKIVKDDKLREQIGLTGKKFIDDKILHEYYVEKLQHLIEKTNTNDTLSRSKLAGGIKKGEKLEKLLSYEQ